EFKQQFKSGNFVEALKIALSEATELKVTTWVAPATPEHPQQAQQPTPGYRLQTRMNLLDGEVNNEIGRAFVEDGPYADSGLWQFHINQVESGQRAIQGNLQGLRELFSTLAHNAAIESLAFDSSPISSLLEPDPTEQQTSEDRLFQQLEASRHQPLQPPLAVASPQSLASQLPTVPAGPPLQSPPSNQPEQSPLPSSDLELNLLPDAMVTSPSDIGMELAVNPALGATPVSAEPSSATVDHVTQDLIQPVEASNVEDYSYYPSPPDIPPSYVPGNYEPWQPADADLPYPDSLSDLSFVDSQPELTQGSRSDQTALPHGSYSQGGQEQPTGVMSPAVPAYVPTDYPSGLPDSGLGDAGNADLATPDLNLGSYGYDPNAYEAMESMPEHPSSLSADTPNLRLLLLAMVAKLRQGQKPTPQEWADLKAASLGLLSNVTQGRTVGESLAAGAAIVAAGALLLWGADRMGIRVPFFSSNDNNGDPSQVITPSVPPTEPATSTVPTASPDANPAATSTASPRISPSPTSITGLTTTASPKVSFADVPKQHWAYPFITAMAERKFVTGNKQGEFLPDKRITRAEFAALISKPLEQPVRRKSITYRDLKQNYWATKVIDEVTRTGFMDGYPKQQFRPERPMIRLEVIVALARGLGLEPTVDPAKTLKVYKDYTKIPKWAVRSLAAATEAGLVVNYPDPAVLNPQRPATRAEAVAIMYQALVKVNRVQPMQSKYIVNKK
ncbi:MAG: S-layer homology domain-containing protein, partial [Cyanobacteria bacterium]|nr:S-layer homology domain-containing protein [Cyanobacteriota bacterium]MDW8200631.1 S-layer homology domain-containing protein [Cyanobacteriota bacterium SKYGB_h_bin112]